MTLNITDDATRSASCGISISRACFHGFRDGLVGIMPAGTVRRTHRHSRPLLNHQCHQSSQPRPLLQPPVQCGMTQWNTASADDYTCQKPAGFWATNQWPEVAPASGLGRNGSGIFKICYGTAVSMVFLISASHGHQ